METVQGSFAEKNRHKRKGGGKINDKQQVYMAASQQMQKAFPIAINALREIAGDEDAPAAARATAAKALLEYGVKMQELSEQSRWDIL